MCSSFINFQAALWKRNKKFEISVSSLYRVTNSKGCKAASEFQVRISYAVIVRFSYKVLTYVDYRAVSGVFRLLTPTPSPPSECVFPPHQRRRGSHSPGDEGVGGQQYFGRRQTLDLPLTVYGFSPVYKSLPAFGTTFRITGGFCNN